MAQHQQVADHLFGGGGEMGALMRSYDWAKTPFGAVEQWPQSLRSALSICLNSRFPMAIYWGPDCWLLYNDAWRPIVGNKHPWSLGRPAYEVWPEIWDDISPDFARVFATGEGVFHSDTLLVMHRFGYDEECFFDYTFNPIQGEDGRVEGILNIGNETTYRVLNDRRARLLRELAARTGTAKTVAATCGLMVEALKADPADIPLALLYLVNADGKTASLGGGTQPDLGLPAVPDQVNLVRNSGGGWPIAPVAQTAQSRPVDDLASRFGFLPGSPWPEPPQEAVVLPILVPGQAKAVGVLVAVASPRRRLDRAYCDFFEQVAGHIATAIANARSHETDRQHAEQLAEQKRLQELTLLALRDSEHRYRTLFELMDQGFCVCELLIDSDGNPADYRFLEVNPAFEALTGLHQPVGKTAKELVPNLEAFWIETYGRVALTRQPHQFEYGSLAMGRWFNVSAFAIGDPPSLRFALLFTNIGDRKAIEQEWERFLSISANVKVIAGSNGYFQWVSPTVERILGWTTDEMIARPWAEFLHPDDRAKSVSEADLLFAGSATQSFENRYRHRDGSYRWFLWNARSYPDEGVLYGAAIDITDRKRMESNLRESEERFRSMADNAPVMIWVTDATGYCTYLSQSWYDFTGQTEETGLGLGWLEAVHPDDQAMSSQTFLTANGRQQGFQLEYRLRHKDGTYHWAIDAASPWLGTDGQFKGYIGSVLDISDRKQIEEALRQRETELRLVTNAVPALIAFVDADQRYRFNNQGYEDWFNQSATDLYGKHIREVVGDAAYENVRPYIEQVLAGQPVTFERSIPFKDGSIRYLSATYVPRFNDTGVVEGFVALINDLSDRRQAEEALIQSEARYRYLVETIPQLVWTANAEGVLIDANQRWCAFTGLTVEQVETVGWPAVVHPDDIPILSQNWAIAQQQGTSYQAEGRMRRADGVYRWHLHQAIPLKTKQGRVLKWFGTATDIEDQKQLEQQRSQLLQQEQAARAAAEAASRTKDEFLAVVSHELRSPLNPILGWATLLQNGTLDEVKTKQALAVIERNAKLQTELIDDLLDVSRMLRGKLQISASPVNLAAIIRAAMETVRLAADAKSIRIEAHMEDDVGLVSGDATRLQQVVWNLLSNAVKFTPAAGQVEVRLAQGKAHQAQITVADTGKGIVPEFLPLIFDYFRQADSATTRQFGGLGLGLAIVRHLVELHGGTIQAASPGEGLGATFTVSLPTLTHPPLAPNDDLRPQPSLNLPGTHVLVVDDDSDTRTFITFLLEQAGASVVAAASAREGLAALGQSRPQVLVSDIGMPDIDGYMLMRQIRALPAEQGGQVPAIALTAYVRETDQEQALAAGFQRHIAKPVEPAALLRAIAELLQIQP